MLSLEKISFYILVQNFERFYIAFTASKDENLQKSFEFLKRRFSTHLATALCVDKKLKEEYFEFLINKHLKFLVGNWFENNRSLFLQENYFCRLSNLTRICFRSCTDEILGNLIKFCPKIVEIDVRHSNVTDDGIKGLCEIKNGMLPCPELKSLFIWRSKVKDEGAAFLILNLPLLERFDYPKLPELLCNTVGKRKLFLNKVQSYNLVELDLNDCRFSDNYSDILKVCLTVCNKLDSIACLVSKKQQLDFFKNTHLKDLRMQVLPNCGKINLDKFLKKNGSNLICLKISNCDVSIAKLAVCCPVLEEFCACYVNFTDNDEDLKEIFAFLTKCSFSRCKALNTKAFRLLLASSPKLECISLRFLAFSPEIKNCILMWCKNSSLKLIEFVTLQLDSQFLTDLFSNCPTLKAMFVNQCFFHFKDVKSFLGNLTAKLPNKPKVYFKRNTCVSDMDDYHEMLRVNAYSLSKVNPKNLESDLKEEYKCSNIYDSLFVETAFDGEYYFPEDDWESNWEII